MQIVDYPLCPTAKKTKMKKDQNSVHEEETVGIWTTESLKPDGLPPRTRVVGEGEDCIMNLIPTRRMNGNEFK